MKIAINKKSLYFTIFTICVFTLLSAYYIEYVIEVKPCKLCLYQRYPYYLSAILSLIGVIYYQKNFIIYLLILSFVASLILSIYHSGIEYGFFPEFTGCTISNSNILDKEELLNSLTNIAPNCKDVTFKILGLSLATINIFISICLIVMIIVFLRYEKNK